MEKSRKPIVAPDHYLGLQWFCRISRPPPRPQRIISVPENGSTFVRCCRGGSGQLGWGGNLGWSGLPVRVVRGPSGLAIVEGPWGVWPGTRAISTLHVVDCRGSGFSCVLKHCLMIFSPGKYFILGKIRFWAEKKPLHFLFVTVEIGVAPGSCMVWSGGFRNSTVSVPLEGGRRCTT